MWNYHQPHAGKCGCDFKILIQSAVWQEASSIGSPSPFDITCGWSLLYSGLQRSLCPRMKNLLFLLWSFDTVCSFTKRTNVRFPLLCTASHSLASLHAYTPLEACYHWVANYLPPTPSNLPSPFQNSAVPGSSICLCVMKSHGLYKLQHLIAGATEHRHAGFCCTLIAGLVNPRPLPLCSPT